MSVKIKNKGDINCYQATVDHKNYVADLMEKIASQIRKRGITHDNSKLEEPEFSGFSEHGTKLAKLEYGSEEYEENLAELKPTLDSHYANSRHHFQHYAEGAKDMTLVDLLELIVDSYASAKRQESGNIRLSVEQMREKHGFSKELESIFKNTIDVIELLDED